MIYLSACGRNEMLIGLGMRSIALHVKCAPYVAERVLSALLKWQLVEVGCRDRHAQNMHTHFEGTVVQGIPKPNDILKFDDYRS